MAQKRCYGQQFRLQPDLLVRQIILDVLGYVLEKYDLVVLSDDAPMDRIAAQAVHAAGRHWFCVVKRSWKSRHAGQCGWNL